MVLTIPIPGVQGDESMLLRLIHIKTTSLILPFWLLAVLIYPCIFSRTRWLIPRSVEASGDSWPRISDTWAACQDSCETSIYVGVNPARKSCNWNKLLLRQSRWISSWSLLPLFCAVYQYDLLYHLCQGILVRKGCTCTGSHPTNTSFPQALVWRLHTVSCWVDHLSFQFFFWRFLFSFQSVIYLILIVVFCSGLLSWTHELSWPSSFAYIYSHMCWLIPESVCLSNDSWYWIFYKIEHDQEFHLSFHLSNRACTWSRWPLIIE